MRGMLTASLRHFEQFVVVKTVIIDALGIDHYIDKFHATRAPNDSDNNSVSVVNDQLVLVNVMRRLLVRQRVTVYVSKCDLYGEEWLRVRWPFSEAGVPRIPQEFMPEVWRSVVGFTVLLYFMMQDEEGGGNERRGVVVLRREGGEGRGVSVVNAAGVVKIGTEGVVEIAECVHVIE